VAEEHSYGVAQQEIGGSGYHRPADGSALRRAFEMGPAQNIVTLCQAGPVE
jgi:hypothetical protein